MRSLGYQVEYIKIEEVLPKPLNKLINLTVPTSGPKFFFHGSLARRKRKVYFESGPSFQEIVLERQVV